MRPGILLDRDGTIIVDYHYVGHIERVQFIPGAIEAIRRFNQAGIPVAIITNQGGVARGFYPESNVHEVHDYITEELAQHGAHIDLFLYSPYHPDGNIEKYTKEDHFHKPEPGMAQYAAMELNLDLHESYVVGDRQTDMEMAGRIGAHAVFIGDQIRHPQGTRPASMAGFSSLADAAGYIIERITELSQSGFPSMHYHGMISYWTHYADEIRSITAKVSGSDIAAAADLLTKAYDDGGHIFVAGNGGAAALADHFACDHINHMGRDGSWFTNVHSLTSNISLLTATANDIGYNSIFSYQIAKLGVGDGDVLVVFSVSGQSENIVQVLQLAKEMGISTIAIVASDGGKAASIADKTIHIPTSNYGLAEDVMQMIMHSIAQYIHQSRMSDRAVQYARF